MLCQGTIPLVYLLQREVPLKKHANSVLYSVKLFFAGKENGMEYTQLNSTRLTISCYLKRKSISPNG